MKIHVENKNEDLIASQNLTRQGKCLDTLPKGEGLWAGWIICFLRKFGKNSYRTHIK